MADLVDIGAAVPRFRNRFLRGLGLGVLRLWGWRMEVHLPDTPKMIVIAAPHTSNWDFVFGMAAILALQLDIHWYAKHTLFKPPWGRFFRALGGLPVDRGAPGGVVEQTAQAYASREQLVIALAPEGTRSRVTRWKRGFYHIALRAQVPVAVAWIDYATRTVGARPVFTPTGDWAADMAPVFAFYRTITPRHPALFATE